MFAMKFETEAQGERTSNDFFFGRLASATTTTTTRAHLRLEELVEVASLAVIHDDAQLAAVRERLVARHDVRVVQRREELRLQPRRLALVSRHPRHVHLLDDEFFRRIGARCHEDCSPERALPERLYARVLVHDDRRRLTDADESVRAGRCRRFDVGGRRRGALSIDRSVARAPRDHDSPRRRRRRRRRRANDAAARARAMAAAARRRREARRGRPRSARGSGGATRRERARRSRAAVNEESPAGGRFSRVVVKKTRNVSRLT